jgi:hypothetical protein
MLIKEVKKKKWSLIHSQGQTSNKSEPYYFKQSAIKLDHPE